MKALRIFFELIFALCIGLVYISLLVVFSAILFVMLPFMITIELFKTKKKTKDISELEV